MAVCAKPFLISHLRIFLAVLQSPPTKRYVSSYRPVRLASAQLPLPTREIEYEEIFFFKTTIRVDNTGAIIMKEAENMDLVEIAKNWQADQRNTKLTVDTCLLVQLKLCSR